MNAIRRMRETATVLAVFAVLATSSLADRKADPSLRATIKLQHGSLQLTSAPFNPARHSIARCTSGSFAAVCEIDGKPFFGSDDEMPETQLMSATLRLDSAAISLDVSSMFDPWFGDRPSDDSFSIEHRDFGWELTGCFSDAAGSYVARWMIVNAHAIRTVLTDDEDIYFASKCSKPRASARMRPNR